MHRLLTQLEQVGAVERVVRPLAARSDARRARRRRPGGAALAVCGATAADGPRDATGALVALSVEMAGEMLVIEVLPGKRAFPLQPEPGMTHDRARLAEMGIDRRSSPRSEHTSRHTAAIMRPVLDVGGVHPEISCVAAPVADLARRCRRGLADGPRRRGRPRAHRCSDTPRPPDGSPRCCRSPELTAERSFQRSNFVALDR